MDKTTKQRGKRKQQKRPKGEFEVKERHMQAVILFPHVSCDSLNEMRFLKIAYQFQAQIFYIVFQLQKHKS